LHSLIPYQKPEYGFLLFPQHCSERGQSQRPCWNMKATLRDFQVQMDNHKIHYSKLAKGTLDEIRLIRSDHSPYSPDIAPSDFGFSGRAKER
jgi:hypothetical protein